MKRSKIYTAADLEFEPYDAAEKCDVLDYLNNPKVTDLAFKKEMAQLGPREISRRSKLEIMRQYRTVKVPLPKRY